jgi:signal transduction histidine kinase
LKGLDDRVAQLGGTFSVANAADRGVQLSAEIPLAVAS